MLALNMAVCSNQYFELLYFVSAEHILKLYFDFDKYLAWTNAVQLLKREQERCSDTLPLIQLQPS